MGDWTQKCKENVSHLEPPVNCSWDFCSHLQKKIDQYCILVGLNEAYPIPEQEMGQDCWCCCSCFAYGTPIEVNAGKFIPVEEIMEGQTVLAAGTDLKWKDTVVKYSSGLGEETITKFMYHVDYTYDDCEEKHRSMLVTADHLFLMASGKLKPVQHLIPGNQLRRADGGVSTVLFCTVGHYKGGLHHIHTGEFDGRSLEGHLISANGLVCADYKVQLQYSTGNLDKNLLSDPPEGEVHEVGSSSYEKAYAANMDTSLLNSPEAWKPGFTPHHSYFIEVPPTAKRFLTDAQSQDVKENAETTGYNNTAPISNAMYLFKLFKTFYPDILYILDWANDQPNAYAWEGWGQKFILLTGGLLRIVALQRAGISLIIADMLAYHQGKECVGEADYEAECFYLRQIWNSDLYFKESKNSIEQIQSVFSYISAENAKENPQNICGQPSIKCRLETFQAAKGMQDIPECAMPGAAKFEVLAAKASTDLKSVWVVFSQEVDPDTALEVGNYKIHPGCSVNTAELDVSQKSRVILGVKGLVAKNKYLLDVDNVLSKDSVPLTPGKDTAVFRT
ncbi:MAG TPA: hypothetical protein VHY08_01920 [Bacillota bacterium]|nr:hypothetical protein [Bacillota bacterium]